MKKALASGAQAVQIGTALLVADECEISPLYKNAVLQSEEQQTTITRAFTGKPARGLANDFTKRMKDAPVAPYPLQNQLTTTIRKESAEQGNPEYLSMWMGEKSYLVKQTGTVKSIIEKLL
ncbi:Nitronate monooxygenase [compost metagenome]